MNDPTIMFCIGVLIFTTVLMWCILGMLICGLGQFVAMYILIKNSNLICSAYNRTHGLG